MFWNPKFGLVILAVVQLSKGLPQFDFASPPSVSAPPSCLQVCPQVFQPVCGNDGKTYENECELENASCRGPRVQKVADNECAKSSNKQCPDACPDNSQPVCGNDGNSYKNECQLQFAACRDPALFKVADGDCEGTSPGSTAPGPSSTFSTFSTFSTTPATTTTPSSFSSFAPACPQFCPVEVIPVCGNDGTTYRNECELAVAACRNPSLFKAAEGTCG
ncbi:hypothetical protein SK128_002936 [Halocaridina rubra]|uniref:Kazal-like domain-containing protein n=1 Tax=Halocaridina rubra TaxID=373956 RepID=A0AAN8XGI0_HALRR